MVELSTIARPYADAAYEVAKASNLQQWTDWMESWSAVASNRDIKLLVDNPKVGDDKVLDIFTELSKTPADAQARNFLAALVENGRLLALPEIARQFIGLKNADAGASEATITSAFTMEDADVQNIKEALEKKFGRQLNITVEVDESLIGGIRVTVGDKVLDSSVRAKLNAMKVALTA